MSGLLVAAEALGRALEGFDARLLSGGDAARVVDALSPLVKRLDAVVARAARRAGECGAHEGEGFSNPSEWLGRKTGSSSGQARGTLELAGALDELPETKEAVEGGELSLEEAREVAKTEGECPGSESEMLDAARQGGLRRVRERGRRRRQEARDPDELARKRRRARGLRRWVDELGMHCGFYRLEPHVAAAIDQRLDAEIDRAFRSGDEERRREPREARAADALVALLDGQGRGPTTRPELVAVYDLDRRRAHIPGSGPIDHAALLELARDAVVTAVAHDGEDIRRYRRWTRHVPKAIRLLLSLGPAPDFDGAVCSSCGRRFHLQLDHIDPHAHRGPTSWENLDPKCPECHDDKTRRDRQAGLLGDTRRSDAGTSEPRHTEPRRARPRRAEPGHTGQPLLIEAQRAPP